MTREEILAMPAGRELDELISEKVMGFVVDRSKGNYLKSCTVYRPNHLIRHAQFFQPSSDISAAWEIVDKLHTNRFLFDIDQSVGAGYTARFYNRDKEVFNIAPYVDTAPLAISRAALLAVMEGSQ